MGRTSKYDASFRAKVALAAIREDRPMSELVKEFGVSGPTIESWKAEFIANASSVFEKKTNNDRELKQLKAENDRLVKKVGQLTIEKDFFGMAYEAAKRRKG